MKEIAEITIDWVRFRVDTRHLSPIQQAIYLRMICASAAHPLAGIADDEEQIRHDYEAGGKNRRNFARYVEPVLKQFFTLCPDGVWRNRRSLATRFAIIISGAAAGRYPIIPKEKRGNREERMRACKALADQFMGAGWDGDPKAVIDAFLALPDHNPITTRAEPDHNAIKTRSRTNGKTQQNQGSDFNSLFDVADKDKDKEVKEIKESTTDGFQSWWSHVALKRATGNDRAKSEASYRKLLKAKFTPTDIDRLTAIYAAKLDPPAKPGQKHEFAKAPQAWLNFVLRNVDEHRTQLGEQSTTAAPVVEQTEAHLYRKAVLFWTRHRLEWSRTEHGLEPWKSDSPMTDEALDWIEGRLHLFNDVDEHRLEALRRRLGRSDAPPVRNASVG